VSLRRVVAAPFARRGVEEVTRAEFIYSLTRDLGWYEPDDAEEVVSAALEDCLLEQDDDALRASLDLSEVGIPEGFEPSGVPSASDANGTSAQGVFERAVERLVGAGYDKREAVAEINRTHADMDGARVEAAALVTARREGVRVADLAEEALGELRSG
jgi:hypothetical protein